MQFEVEQKFEPNPESIAALTADAEFIEEKILNDKYFDNEKRSLTCQDIWLRNRNGRFEMKLPMNPDVKERALDQYQELEGEEAIAEHFGWDLSIMEFESHLVHAGLASFIEFTSTRQKFCHPGGFNIDIDKTDFGYDMLEIELLVDEKEKMPEAAERIQEMAKAHGLAVGEYRYGKSIELIRRQNPEHFQKLIEAGVIK